MAAGKSAVAQALAERLPKSVHLRGDIFRRMIISGREEMGMHPSDTARAQLLLRYRMAADTARSYLDAGFSVVYQDVILGPDLLNVITLHSHRPLYLVVLSPPREIVAKRASGRSKRSYDGAITVNDLDRVLRETTPRIGLWLDNSDITVSETAEQILAQLSSAEVFTNGAAT